MRVSHINLFVFDQEQALDFYTGKLGFEVGDDQDLGFMRWLTVHPAGAPDVRFILCDPTGLAGEKVELIREVLSAGLGGGPLIEVEDCRASYQELAGRGVNFTQEPTQMPYGTDCELVDPFGNRLRLVQNAAVAA